MIHIPITHDLYISEDQLIREEHLTKDSSHEEVAKAVYDYICELDDIYFYSLTEDSKNQIIEGIWIYLTTKL